VNSDRILAIGSFALLLKTTRLPSGVQPATVLPAPRKVRRVASPPAAGIT